MTRREKSERGVSASGQNTAHAVRADAACSYPKLLTRRAHRPHARLTVPSTSSLAPVRVGDVGKRCGFGIGCGRDDGDVVGRSHGLHRRSRQRLRMRRRGEMRTASHQNEQRPRATREAMGGARGGQWCPNTPEKYAAPAAAAITMVTTTPMVAAPMPPPLAAWPPGATC